MLDDKLKEVLAGVFDLRPTDIHSGLTRDNLASWDSLKQMDLVVSIEQAYDISLSFEEIVGISSVDHIEAILAEKGIQ